MLIGIEGAGSSACFIKLVEGINPYMEVHGLNPAEDALLYVEWILAYKARKGLASFLRKNRPLDLSTDELK
jgi:hypothetical protein